MYDPIQDGIEKKVQSVNYNEAKPPSIFANLVHNFWQLKTEKELSDDFCLHALPDACVNILFNQVDTKIAGVTALRTTYQELNLGKDFHYVGVQFFPGVWQANLSETSDSFVGSPYLGGLPLIDTNNALVSLDFPSMQEVLSKLVQQLVDRKLVAPNVITAKILANIDSIHTVVDMATVANMSARQLQRKLKRSTGFSPHDFLKVIRLQQSFKQHYLDFYSDQSHFIHEFRKITGCTPAEYYKKYNV